MQPGLVSPTAKAHVPVTLKVTGREFFRDLVPDNARQELTQAIDFAGFAGDFTLAVLGKVKGTAHTKGLRIRSPQNDAVEITCQFGDNGSCVECKLIVPSRINSLVFYSKLKEAHSAMVGEGRPKKPGEKTNVIPLHPDVELASSVGDGVSDLEAAVASSVAAVASESDSQSHIGFIQRDDDVKLFMLYVSERAKNGRITTEACTTILIEEFGFKHRRLAAPTLGSFLNKKLLLRSEVKGVYELPPEYRGASSTPLPSAEVSSPTGAEFAKKLAELEAEAETADVRVRELRTELVSITSRRAVIEPELKQLREELSGINSREAALMMQIEQLEVGNTAKRRLEQIKALLG